MEEFFSNEGFRPIAECILSYLTSTDLAQFRKVCTSFMKFVDDPKYWKIQPNKFEFFFFNPKLRHIGLTIIQELEVPDVIRLRRVCKSMKNMVDDAQFWLENIKTKKMPIPLLAHWKKFIKKADLNKKPKVLLLLMKMYRNCRENHEFGTPMTELLFSKDLNLINTLAPLLEDVPWDLEFDPVLITNV